MKYLFIIAFSITLLISCDSNSEISNNIQVSSTNVTVNKPETEPVTKPVKEFKNKSTGSFIERHSNGNLKTEGWKNSASQRDGVWYSYYEHGTKWSELTYVNGIKEGVSVVYFPSAKIHYQGQYKNDKKIGKWTFYKKDGTIESEKKY